MLLDAMLVASWYHLLGNWLGSLLFYEVPSLGFSFLCPLSTRDENLFVGYQGRPLAFSLEFCQLSTNFF